MILHLRRNAVAYLALFVALSGTSYAAVSLPRGSVGARQLKKDAVTSVKVRDGSLSANDFGAGQLPAGPAGAPGARGAVGAVGPVYGATRVGDDSSDPLDPPAAPTFPATSFPYMFKLPAAGPTYIAFDVVTNDVTCQSGGGSAGLYVDGTPVPGTSVPVGTATAPLPLTIAGKVTLSAGSHQAAVREYCLSGAFMGSGSSSDSRWTVLLLGS